MPPIYTELRLCSAAASALPDHALEKEVIRFARIPPDLLVRLANRPLVLGRQVATPMRETAHFFELAERLERPPLIMTMPKDRFTPAVNGWKRGLAKLALETRHNIRYATVVDFQKADNRSFCDIRCIDGTPFLQLHGELLVSALGPRAVQAAIDATGFFRGESGLERYQRFFSLFTCFGVLAESYVFAGSESRLLEEAVLPAFEHTIKRFGRSPVIARLLPEGEESDPRWDRYPACVLPRALCAAGRPVAAAKLARLC